MRRDTVLFDINESILDLSSLRPKFKAAFGDEAVTGLWFSNLLHSSTVCALTGVKTNFGNLASAMLDTVAARLNITLSVSVRDEILGAFAHLPVHGDVKPALERFRSSGYRTIAFSNSSIDLIERQIQNAGLSDYYDDIVSVEKSGSFKPDAKAYLYVANYIDRPIGDLCLVATHDWDTHGAMTAGMMAAYIDRSGVPYHPLYLKPGVYSTSMDDIVTQVLKQDGHANAQQVDGD